MVWRADYKVVCDRCGAVTVHTYNSGKDYRDIARVYAGPRGGKTEGPHWCVVCAVVGPEQPGSLPKLDPFQIGNAGALEKFYQCWTGDPRPLPVDDHIAAAPVARGAPEASQALVVPPEALAVQVAALQDQVANLQSQMAHLQEVIGTLARRVLPQAAPATPAEQFPKAHAVPFPEPGPATPGDVSTAYTAPPPLQGPPASGQRAGRAGAPPGLRP